jgi:hypothetical protein
VGVAVIVYPGLLGLQALPRELIYYKFFLVNSILAALEVKVKLNLAARD